MFKASLIENNLFKSAFEAVSSIVGEIQISADVDGLSLKALDQSHITFVTMTLRPELFENYSCDENLKLNIDTEEFIKVLKRLKSDDTLIIEASEDDSKLKLILDSEAKRTFKLNLIDLEYEPPSPPDLEFPSVFKLDFAEFKRTLGDVELFSETITLEYSDEDKKLLSYGAGDYGEASVEGYDMNDDDLDNSHARSKYTIEKIKPMLKADKLTDRILIKLGTDMPLSLTLQHKNFLKAEDLVLAELSYLLAPRIESGEE